MANAAEELQGTWQSKKLGAIGYDNEPTDTDGDLFFIIDGSHFTFRTKEKVLSKGTIRMLSSNDPKMYELITSTGPWRREIYQITENGKTLTSWMGPVHGRFTVTDKGRTWQCFSTPFPYPKDRV